MIDQNYPCNGSWDWHQHSTYSDGVLTPTQLVARAKAWDLTGLALTDHDTVAGVDEALTAGKAMGISVVTGVELSVQGAGEVHILGYHLDQHERQLVAACETFADARTQRLGRMRAYLEGQGIGLSEAEIMGYSADGVVGRPHVAQAMVAGGYVATIGEAFERYLDTAAFRQATARVKPSSETAIALIRQAGGVAVLAHPLSTEKSGKALYDYLIELKGYGLGGLEAYHPTHDPGFSGMCLDFAKRLGLIVTWGSDFHSDAR